MKHFRVQSDLKGVTHSNLKQYVPTTGFELAGDLDDDYIIWRSTRLYDVWFAMARNVFTTFGVACITTSWGCGRRVYIHATRDRSTALVIPYHYIPVRIGDSRVTRDPCVLLASFLLDTSLLVLVIV